MIRNLSLYLLDSEKFILVILRLAVSRKWLWVALFWEEWGAVMTRMVDDSLLLRKVFFIFFG